MIINNIDRLILNNVNLVSIKENKRILQSFKIICKSRILMKTLIKGLRISNPIRTFSKMMNLSRF